MKKLLFISALVIALGSCTNSYKLTTEQFNESPYSTKGMEILKGEKAIAKVSSIEYELYRGKLVKEISLTLEGLDLYEINGILRYMHTKYPKAKIEVNTDNYNFGN